MPGRTQSNRDVRLVLDGERITGFAAVERPVEHPNESWLNKKVGADGAHYNMDNAQLGGMVTVHLASSSRSIPWLLKRRERRLTEGALDSFKGSYSIPKDGLNVEYFGCSWEQIPPTYEPGQDFTFAFDVERIDPNADSITLQNASQAA